MPDPNRIEVSLDPGARSWLDAHATDASRVLAYDVHRCCGGGRLCRAFIRERSAADRDEDYVSATVEGGGRFLVDRRAASRLPAHFGLTMRGRGRFRRLDLDLTPEQWGDLLYS